MRHPKAERMPGPVRLLRALTGQAASRPKVGARLRGSRRAASTSHTDPAHTPCDSTASSAPPGHAAHVDLDRRLSNSQLVLYPDAGHGGVFQFHEDFVTRALEFL